MPATAAQVQTLRNMVGQGEIYSGCTKPATNTAIALTAGVPAGGTSVGLTSGPASLDYKPEFKGVEIEQAYGEVAPRVTKESVTLKFKCAESTYDKLQLALQTATHATTAGSGATPTKNTLYIGGLTFFNDQCICLVSNIGSYVYMATTVQLYEWVCIYSAMSVSGLKLDWKRGETRMVEVEITGYADVTRNEGDQLFQIGQQKDPST
jgi:hypothetical protein